MLQNYLFSAWRSLLRQKLSTSINIFGLTLGLAACILIFLFVRHEFSYDTQFTDAGRLYRIEATANIPGQPSNNSPQFFGPSYDLLGQDFEEIASVTRLQQRGGTVINGDDATAETFATVDSNFLSLFDFPLLVGNSKTALDAPGSIVLTEGMAKKYLGDKPWLGRSLTINETIEREMKVTAVMADIPGNTHFDIDFLVPIEQRIYDATASAGNTDLGRWNGLPFNVYIKLKPANNIASVRAGINDWVDKYFPPQIQALVGIKGSELFTPRIMAVPDIHMYSPVNFDMKAPGNINTIYSFSAIALLMLIIACINFINLATAASTLRAKEVALRKVMGASRKQLFSQFQLESLLTALFSLFFALLVIELVLPAFSNFTQRDLSIAQLAEPLNLMLVLLLTILVGFLAGLHPALVLSGFRPARVLQSGKSDHTGVPWLRSALVLFQFTISAALIILTLLVYIQTDYAKSQNLGYRNDDKLSVRGLFQQQIGNLAETVRDEVARLPGVKKVSLASFTPGDGNNVGLSLKVPGADSRTIIFYRAVYPEFFDQFDVQAVAGRLLDNQHPKDRTVFIDDPDSIESQDLNVVINQSAVKKLGFSSADDAVGKFYYRGRQNQIVNTIVGVIPDIHFGSPRSDLDAEIYMYVPAQVGNLIVTYDADQFKEVNAAITDKLNELLPKAQIRIQHLQENISDQYQEESIQSALLAMFSGLAVLIACIGLFGLASFTISRRTKEIGIRKVMGASSGEIVLLLLSQFSRPVVIANILAWPICWYFISDWLQGFNLQIALLPWFLSVCVAAAAVTLMLAWITVASHAYQVARTSPIFALRYE